MAEIKFNNIYDQMSGTVKNYYDGAAFGQSFADQYDPDKRVANIDEVTGLPTGTFTDTNPNSLTMKDGYTQMVDAYNQEQQSKTKNSFLSSLANFGSADASEIMPTNGLQTNSMGGITLNPDGTLNYNNTQPQNLDFRSMVDMANDANNFDSQFVSPNRFNSMGQMGPVKSNMNAPTIDRSNVIGEDIDMQYDNPNYEDIDMGYTDNSFNTQPKQGILQGKIGGLRDFLPFGDKSLSGLAVKGIRSLFNRNPNAPSYQTRSPDIDYSNLNTNNLNDFYDSNEDSETFGTTRFDRATPGSFGSFRTLSDYFNRNKNAAAALTTRKAKKEAAMQQQIKDAQAAQAQQRAREAATADRARAANSTVYSNADAGGFTRGGGGFASHNTGTNNSFSNKTGKGRTGYQDGGLASMFTRRR